MRRLLVLALILGWGSLALALNQTPLPDVAPKPGWDTLPPVRVSAADWPWWRGPQYDNVAPADQTSPLAWSDTSNVIWRTRLPGVGHSSPSVMGDRIYLTSGLKTKENATVWLFGLDRATGKTLWQTELYKGAPPKMHPDNSVASATPACDGKKIFVPLQTDQNMELVAVGVDGRIAWRRTVAPYNTLQGYSASLTFYKSAVLVPVEGPKGCYLTAFHRETGEIVWRKSIRAAIESYAPVVFGRSRDANSFCWSAAQARAVTIPRTAICCGNAAVRRGRAWRPPFRMATASMRRADIPVGFSLRCGPTVGGTCRKAICAGLRTPRSAMCLRRCWTRDCFTRSQTRDCCGVMSCERRVRGTGVEGVFYSSPVIVGNRLYLFDRKGNGYVFPVGREGGEPSISTLPSGVFATPVIVAGRMYLRTLGDFYCIGGTR